MTATGLRVVPLPLDREVVAGDDLVEVIQAAATAAGVALADGDVVCVASKVVSKAEGATAAPPPGVEDPDAARRAIARARAARIVADTEQVLITATEHGFVAANGGVDLSNAGDAGALLLPPNPDGSAARIRSGLAARAGADIGVIVTDTFGRPWRMGQTDVALGVAGTAALRDERGGTDRDGRPLDVTVAAVADEVAGAADLVRSKGAGIPFVLVRGLPATDRAGTGSQLVRPLEEDLFPHGGPTAAAAVVAGRRTVRSFSDDPVADEVVAAAVGAATTAPAPHGTRPWRFLDLADDTRTRLLDAMAERWRADLRGDGVDEATIERRLRRSDAILRTAPRLLAPFVVTDGAHEYPDDRRAGAERDMFMLAGGAALEALQVVLAAHGVGAAWISSTLFCAPTVRAALDLPDHWHPLGLIAVGRPAEPSSPRHPRDPGPFLRVE